MTLRTLNYGNSGIFHIMGNAGLGGALVQLFSAPRIYCDEQGSWMTTGLGKGKGNLWQRLSRSQPVRVIFPPGLGKTGKRRASFAQSWLLGKTPIHQWELTLSFVPLKIARRRDDDISIVNACIRVCLKPSAEGWVVEKVEPTAAVPKHLRCMYGREKKVAASEFEAFFQDIDSWILSQPRSKEDFPATKVFLLPRRITYPDILESLVCTTVSASREVKDSAIGKKPARMGSAASYVRGSGDPPPGPPPPLPASEPLGAVVPALEFEGLGDRSFRTLEDLLLLQVENTVVALGGHVAADAKSATHAVFPNQMMKADWLELEPIAAEVWQNGGKLVTFRWFQEVTEGGLCAQDPQECTRFMPEEYQQLIAHGKGLKPAGKRVSRVKAPSAAAPELTRSLQQTKAFLQRPSGEEEYERDLRKAIEASLKDAPPGVPWPCSAGGGGGEPMASIFQVVQRDSGYLWRVQQVAENLEPGAGVHLATGEAMVDQECIAVVTTLVLVYGTFLMLLKVEQPIAAFTTLIRSVGGFGQMGIAEVRTRITAKRQEIWLACASLSAVSSELYCMMQLGVYFFLPEVAGVPPYKQVHFWTALLSSMCLRWATTCGCNLSPRTIQAITVLINVVGLVNRKDLPELFVPANYAGRFFIGSFSPDPTFAAWVNFLLLPAFVAVGCSRLPQGSWVDCLGIFVNEVIVVIFMVCVLGQINSTTYQQEVATMELEKKAAELHLHMTETENILSAARKLLSVTCDCCEKLSHEWDIVEPLELQSYRKGGADAVLYRTVFATARALPWKAYVDKLRFPQSHWHNTLPPIVSIVVPFWGYLLGIQMSFINFLGEKPATLSLRQCIALSDQDRFSIFVSSSGEDNNTATSLHLRMKDFSGKAFDAQLFHVNVPSLLTQHPQHLVGIIATSRHNDAIPSIPEGGVLCGEEQGEEEGKTARDKPIRMRTSRRILDGQNAVETPLLRPDFWEEICGSGTAEFGGTSWFTQTLNRICF
ncbi:hypothetical protein AK812_SmicGene38792 [Symbiodinium microadriaticum]|uniref:BRCT domain-containing protein n=1 Tax=Symbiodinium microadriaticum TaxID=2951 RepID=A0A1Q9CCV6_SYMMI|nr:hypothetical protein AK812_SmicGene38792 [Symbiodinium microadriaticum]